MTQATNTIKVTHQRRKDGRTTTHLKLVGWHDADLYRVVAHLTNSVDLAVRDVGEAIALEVANGSA